jgi:hypothetical protein
MAHYRFSLFLLTCIACFAFVPSRDQDDRDRLLTRLYNQNPTSISMTSSEGGSFSDDQRMLLGIAPVIAQAPAPKTQKSTPNQAKPTSDTKPPKPKPSNARIPISINSIFQFIKRQKILLILSLAAVLVTGASVFVLLKLLENGEENHLKLNPNQHHRIIQPAIKTIKKTPTFRLTQSVLRHQSSTLPTEKLIQSYQVTQRHYHQKITIMVIQKMI